MCYAQINCFLYQMTRINPITAVVGVKNDILREKKCPL